jgi:hypothetical protein
MSQPCPHLGLIVSATRHASASPSLDRALREELLALLEADGLVSDAAAGAHEYVVTREGGQVTDADRRLLLDWASRWAHAMSIRVSPVVDLGDDA